MSKDSNEPKRKRFRKIRLAWKLLTWGLRAFAIYRAFKKRQESYSSPKAKSKKAKRR